MKARCFRSGRSSRRSQHRSDAARRRRPLGPGSIPASVLASSSLGGPHRRHDGHCALPPDPQRRLGWRLLPDIGLQFWHLPRSATPARGLIGSAKDQLRYAQCQWVTARTPRRTCAGARNGDDNAPTTGVIEWASRAAVGWPGTSQGHLEERSDISLRLITQIEQRDDHALTLRQSSDLKATSLASSCQGSMRRAQWPPSPEVRATAAP